MTTFAPIEPLSQRVAEGTIRPCATYFETYDAARSLSPGEAEQFLSTGPFRGQVLILPNGTSVLDHDLAEAVRNIHTPDHWRR